MKKNVLLVVIAMILLVSLVGCGGDDKGTSEQKDSGNSEQRTIELTDKKFINYTMNIHTNPEKYLGDRIEMEGLFSTFYLDDDVDKEEKHYYVFRYGANDSHEDTQVGFEVKYKGDYPKKNDWVKISGILKSYESNDIEYIYIDVDELEVMDESGEERVE